MAQTFRVEAILQKYTKLVDPVIKQLLAEGVSRQTRQLLHYQVNTGGKRLRPALAIASCLACGGKIQDVLYPAAGLEILHNYTLIVDDIIDHSTKRRGKPTVWAKFGKSIAECIAIDYAAAIWESAQYTQQYKTISALFSKALKAITEGQILDILFENSGRENEPYIKDFRPKNITEKDYIKMVGGKTASLFETSCKVGGVCAGATQKQLKALQEFGHHFGIVFQISDDLLDIFGNQTKFGKKIGKDIEERKRGNILIMYTLQLLQGKDKKHFESILVKPTVVASDLRRATPFIKKTDAAQKATVLLQQSLKKTKSALNSLPKNRWQHFLSKLTDFIEKREK